MRLVIGLWAYIRKFFNHGLLGWARMGRGIWGRINGIKRISEGGELGKEGR